MNGTARGRGRNSHDSILVASSIDRWNGTAESTAQREKWSFIFDISVFGPQLVACANDPAFPSTATVLLRNEAR
jgi:hypothetical protein